MDPILQIARRHNLSGHRGLRSGTRGRISRRRCGSIGDMGCFSFYPGKNLGRVRRRWHGNHRQPGIAKTIRMLRDWGAEKKYEHVLKGFNYRMEGIQGAVLRVKLSYLTVDDARRAHAAAYAKLLANTGLTLLTADARRANTFIMCTPS